MRAEAEKRREGEFERFLRRHTRDMALVMSMDWK